MTNASLYRHFHWLSRITCAAAIAVLISACGADGSATNSVKVTPSAVAVAQPPPLAPTVTNNVQPEPAAFVESVATVATAAATQAATQAATATPNSLLIWWPASLYAPVDTLAGRMLRGQIDAYAAQDGETISIRVKRDDGPGGIFESLRTGSPVAPSVMPDLALMRRDDIVQAAAGKLLYPIDMSLFAPDDLFPAGIALGRVNGAQYGVPYTLELQHALYRTSAMTAPPHSLNDLLLMQQPYLFPAGAAKGVNSTLLAQYTAAGGRISDDKGASVLDLVPLQKVLGFYEQAAAAKQISAQLLDYTSASQYFPLLTSGKASIVQVDSTLYLARRSSLADIGTTAIPLPAGSPVSLVDGWLWVMTTGDPDRQTRALAVLAWFMRPDQQGRLTQALGTLPSQRSALHAWGSDPYVDFARTLLDQPAVAPPDLLDPAVASALQRAFEDVVSLRKSSETAAGDAVAQITGK